MPAAAVSEARYGPGTDAIKIAMGNIVAYGGSTAMVSAIRVIQTAFFKPLREQAGVNGREIRLVSYDDACSPPKTVQQVRRHVEGDEVGIIFASAGTATNVAITH
jgi:branched-chain amino acid transport system substrate-binding protein